MARNCDFHSIFHKLRLQTFVTSLFAQIPNPNLSMLLSYYRYASIQDFVNDTTIVVPESKVKIIKICCTLSYITI